MVIQGIDVDMIVVFGDYYLCCNYQFCCCGDFFMFGWMYVFEFYVVDVVFNFFQILVNWVFGEVQFQGFFFIIQYYLFRLWLVVGVGLFNLFGFFCQYVEYISLVDGFGFCVLVSGF